MREGAGGLQSLHLSRINMELKWPKNEEHYDPGKISWLKFHSSPHHGLLMRKILSAAISNKMIFSKNRECSYLLDNTEPSQQPYRIILSLQWNVCSSHYGSFTMVCSSEVALFSSWFFVFFTLEITYKIGRRALCLLDSAFCPALVLSKIHNHGLVQKVITPWVNSVFLSNLQLWMVRKFLLSSVHSLKLTNTDQQNRVWPEYRERVR